jgi:hypothetical protein
MVELVVPVMLLLGGGSTVPVVSDLAPFKALLAPEWRVPFVPVAAPLDPMVEFIVPLALWADAADTIPKAKLAAITPTPICF